MRKMFVDYFRHRALQSYQAYKANKACPPGSYAESCAPVSLAWMSFWAALARAFDKEN